MGGEKGGVGEGPPGHNDSNPVGGIRGWIGSEPLQAATVAGLLIYGSFRLDYFLFYGAFGVTPEEVGHGYISTLARAVVGGSFFFILTFATLFVVVGFLGSAMAAAVTMFEHHRRAAVILSPVVLAGGFVLGWFLLPLLAEPDHGGPRVVSSIMFAIGSWIAVSSNFEQVRAEWNFRRIAIAIRQLVTYVSAMAAFVVFFVLMPLLADQDASAVRAGHARRAQYAGLLNLPWGGDIAYVEWLDAEFPDSFEDDECFMYLGRSSGMIVLWDPREEKVYRVPEGKALLTSPDVEECV